jgi:hypothetical protein
LVIRGMTSQQGVVFDGPYVKRVNPLFTHSTTHYCDVTARTSFSQEGPIFKHKIH